MSNINVNNITPLAGTTGTVSVSGSLVVSGSITANGNIILGNEAGDSVSLGAEVSSSIIPDATDTYDLGSPTKRWRSGSFEYISASKIDVDAATLSIGGTPFSKTDLDSIKDGKPLGTGIKQFKSPTDDSVYIRQSVAGKSWHYASDVALMKVQTSSFDLGAGNVPTTLEGSAITVTGSTEVTGSVEVSGSFTVNDLLTVLADFGQTGSFSVSGSSTLNGDVNLDGTVNVQDVLTVVAGFNASGSNTVTGSLTVSASSAGLPALNITGSTDLSGSLLLSGPAIVSGTLDLTGATTISDVLTVLEGFNSTGSIDVSGSTAISGSLRVNTGNEAISLDTGTGGFTVNNLLDVLANYSSSGVEGGVASGDINLDGQVNVNDMLLVLAGFGNPNLIVSNTVIPPNVNHQFIGPEMSINTDITLSVSTGSFCSITL